jgi:hypothetical protein
MRNGLDSPGFVVSHALPQYSLVGLRDWHRRLVGNRKPKSFSEFKALFLRQLEDLGSKRNGGHDGKT